MTHDTPSTSPEVVRDAQREAVEKQYPKTMRILDERIEALGKKLTELQEG